MEATANRAGLIQTLIQAIKSVDLNLLNTVSVVYFVTSVIVLTLLLSGITAPYGRYARSGWGLSLNGKLAWFVQEIPSFAVPVLFMLTSAPGLKKIPNIFLFSMFLVHYFQR